MRTPLGSIVTFIDGMGKRVCSEFNSPWSRIGVFLGVAALSLGFLRSTWPPPKVTFLPVSLFRNFNAERCHDQNDAVVTHPIANHAHCGRKCAQEGLSTTSSPHHSQEHQSSQPRPEWSVQRLELPIAQPREQPAPPPHPAAPPPRRPPGRPEPSHRSPGS